MARKRTIAPGFFKNEDLGECSPLARLLFAGMWCWADREGRLEDRPRRIKAEILPYDEGDADALVAELAARGFIVRYEAAGVKVIQVVEFHRHQDPHPREAPSTLPDQSGLVPPASPRPARGSPKAGPGHDPGPSQEHAAGPPEDAGPRPGRAQGEPEEEPSNARPSQPSRPSCPSRPARQPADAGGRAGEEGTKATPLRRKVCLGAAGGVFVARCVSGMELGSLTPLQDSDDAKALEDAIRAHGGVDGAVAHVAATFRNRREFKPRSVKLLLDVLRDVLPEESGEPPAAAGGGA